MRTDTIAAIATGMSNSGIGIVRISGGEAFAVIDRIFRNKAGKPVKLSEERSHTVHYGFIYDGDQRVDEALVVYMADKLCRGDRRVSVSGRFRASFDKCRDAEALAAHDRRYKAALTAAHTINDICGKEVIPI